VKVNAFLRELDFSAIQNMHEVAYYYVIDALRCQELIVKQNVINNYKKIASIAYVSLFNSYYQANEMKMQNLLSTYAIKYNMLFNTRQCKNIEKNKYSNAYIFLSKKGIEIKRPIMKLDFISLYFSFIMSYNFSLEKMILTYEEANII